MVVDGNTTRIDNYIGGFAIITWTWRTGDGTTTWTAPAGVTQIEYLVIAGGGAGGGGNNTLTGGGGGGGGGVLTASGFNVAGSLSVIVGTGGITGGGSGHGGRGGSSTFSTIIAGGGYGGLVAPCIYSCTGVGGAGGGGGAGTGGNGNGRSSGSPGNTGPSNSISGVATIYAGGGGGGGDYYDYGQGGAGGAGGGGAGCGYNCGAGASGFPGTSGLGGGGGGGEGWGYGPGGVGGSGTVIIKYAIPPVYVSVTNEIKSGVVLPGVICVSVIADEIKRSVGVITPVLVSVANEIKRSVGVILPIPVSVTHTLKSSIWKMITIEKIEPTIVVTDLAKYDGMITNDYVDDPVSISDSVETSNIDYTLEMDDSVSVSDKNYNVELFSDSIKIYAGVAATIFTPETLKTVSGTQFYLSSQHPSPGTFVNVFKRYSHPIQVEFVECTDTFQLVQRRGGSTIFDTTYDGGSIPTGREPTPTYLPNGNLPNNYTIAGDNGSFVVKGLSLGVYVFVSIKPGYTFGWRRIDVTSDTTTVDLFLAPIMSWNYVEKIYNIYGHSLKMYHLSNYVDPLDGNRVVDGILVFGDLYGDGNQGNSTQIDSSGYLELDTTYNPGQLFLMSMPDLGEQGFFDIEQGEQVYGNSAHTRITWSGKVGPREFDGFAFRMKFPPDRVGILNLSIATGLVIPMPYGDGAPVIGIVSSGSRVLGSGTHVSGGSWWGRGRAYDPGTGAWGDIPSSPGVAYTPSNPPPPYVPPPWNPTFAVSFTEGFSTFEEDMGLRIIRSGIYIEQLNLVDAVQVDEDFGTPPTLTMRGVAQNEAGAPIVGAMVHLIAIRNGVVVGSTTSDANGLWSISNLESELEYRVVVSAPLLGYYSTSANIQVYDKDIVDNRAWQILEAQAFNVGANRSQFLDARIILPPMSLLGIADGRIWGEVTDAASGTSLGGVLVEAYPGWLAEGELDLYSPQIKSDTTGTRSFYVDGYYEIFVPKGKWTVRAKKGRFSKSQVYLVEMVAGYNLDIPIVAQVLAGTVYDRDRFNATGEKIPIAGATVSLGQYSTVTDSEGKYNLVAVTEEGTAYIISCIATNYAEETRSVTFVGTDLIAGFDIYLMKVRIYGSIGGN